MLRHFALSFAVILSFCVFGYGEELSSLVQVPGGVLVHLGCGDGSLTEQLPASEALLVHGLDKDPENVTAARQRLQSAGLYGRITVDAFDGTRLPYVDSLVNQAIDSSTDAGVPVDEFYRAIAPYGVVVVRKETLASRAFSSEQWSPATLPESARDWAAFQKRWPAELDEWTHWLYGPANNAVSKDRQVGVSRNLQWIMPPLWARNHNLLPSVSAMVSAKGRLYYIIDEGGIGIRGLPDKWNLVARDAFNGLELWKRPIANWGWHRWSDLEFSGMMRFKGPSQLFRRLVAAGDVLYATLGFDQPIVAIDGATGETLREYAGTERTAEILYDQGQLLLVRNTVPNQPGQDILAVDAESGEILWQNSGHQGTSGHGDELHRFADAYLTLGGSKLYFIDGDDVVGIDRATGEEAWRTPRPVMEKGLLGHYDFNHANLCTLVYYDGILFLGQMYPFKDNLNSRQQKSMVLRAMDAESGSLLWEAPGMSLAHFTPPDVFVARGLVWTLKEKEVSLLGLDLRTGEVRQEYPVKDMLVGHHHRCYRNKSTEQFYLAGEEGIEYIDFESGELDVHHWMRGACDYGILPANGCIYLPTHSCGCHANAKLHGFIALTTRPSPQAAKAEDQGRLVRGSEDVTVQGTDPSSEDWPMFKSDAARSNSVTTTLPDKIDLNWRVELGGDLTAPIVADGKVYVASRQKQQLSCLDAGSGELRWAVTTEGRLDTPPTYYRGRLVFGTRSGIVTMLAADSGRLLWRFRAAPVDTRLAAFDALESPWPVNGSLLVQDDLVYCVAGRSMHLNGGLYLFALDVKTGEVVHENRLIADTEPVGEVKGAVLPDILVSNGASLFMRGKPLDAETLAFAESADGGPKLSASDGGLLDPTWFNSSFWNYRANKAQMLVFDEQGVYGISAYDKMVSKSYPHDIYSPGKGYHLFAADMTGKPSQPKDQRRGKGNSKPALRWEQRIDLRADAMALTARRLCLAGSPDAVDKKDPWGAFEGRQGGMLRIVSTDEGRQLSEHRLDAIPVHDGLIAARGCVYLSLADGTLVCFAAAP